MSSKKKTTSTTQSTSTATSAPTDFTQPYINQAAGALQSAYGAANDANMGLLNTGKGLLSGYTSTQANNSDAVRSAMARANTIGSGQANDSLSNFANGNFGSSPLTAYASGNFGSNPLTGMASGNFNGNYLSDVAGGNYGDTALTGFANGQFGDNALTKAASGSMVGNNTDFNTALGSSLDDVQRRINAQFGSSGAVNQTSHLDLLARDLGSTAATARATQYNTDAQRAIDAQNSLLGYQTGAANSLFGARTSAANSLLGAQTGAANSLLGAQTGAANSLLSTQASAANADRSSQQAALGLLPSLTNAGFAGATDINSLISLLSGLPANAGSSYANSIASLLNPYKTTDSAGTEDGTTTEKTSGLGNALNVYSNYLKAAGSAASAA